MRITDKLFDVFASPENLKIAFGYIKHEVRKSSLTGKRIENWIENLEAGLDFAVQARYRFATGSLADKRDILATIGSNIILEDKKLRLDAQKPYCYLTEILKVEPTASAEFEPEKRAEDLGRLESLWTQNPSVQG